MLTEEQKQMRSSGIGGSDAAAVCGINKYKSALDVYLEKIGAIGEEEESEPAYWGKVLEPVVAQEYMRRNNLTLTVPTKTFRSKQYPWMIANIDGWIKEKNAVWDGKTTSSFLSSNWGNDYTDHFPTEYLIQCAHYRIVTNASYVDLSVLIGGQKYKEYRYEKCTKTEEMLIAIEHKFWHEYVLKQTPPPLRDYDDACKLFNNPEKSAIVINNEIYELLKRYKEIMDQIHNHEIVRDNIKTQICAYMGMNSLLVNEYEKKLASWNLETRRILDTDRLKKEEPEIYQKYIKIKESRTLRIGKIEG